MRTAIQTRTYRGWRFGAGLWLVGLLIGPAAGCWGAESAEPETNKEARGEELFNIPKSVFVFDQERGRDPFYPRSTRFRSREPEPAPTVSVDGLVERYVRLVGITGTEENRVALINDQTFKEGDAADVRLTDRQRLRVTVVRVLERSVVIRVEGSQREYEKALAE
jgi:hypothetical protein